MARYNGPPIFHSYSLFCLWPDLVHHTFRDGLLHSPLGHIASQLMGDSGVRVFNTFSMGVERGQVVPLRWHADYPVFSGGGDCDQGLVAWMPVKAVSEYEANGMVVARRSHTLHQEIISNGSWSKYSASNSGQIRLLEFYQQIGETFPLERARLHPGDVVIFSKESSFATMVWG